ncbi:hypothetical protein P7H17_04015 [Paenibacillus larvae]|nr:hypothetical protein [Paenibacillus larvae]MDT2285435.1 hypothetical protein [Paenibacillus larvae]
MWISLPPTIMAACTRGTAAAARGNMAAMPDSLTANVLEASPKALKDEIHGRLRSILDAPDTGTARFLLKQTQRLMKIRRVRRWACWKADLTMLPPS